MSEVTGDPAQIDALAAEYVLGTLDHEERTQARALLAADEGFAAKVKMWERRLGELHLMVEPVEPDGKIWERIKAKVPQVPPAGEIKLPESPQEGEPGLAPAADVAASGEATAEAVETTATAEAKPAAEETAAVAPVAAAANERSSTPRFSRTLTPAAEVSAPSAPEAARAPTAAPPGTRDERVAAPGGGLWRALAVLLMLVLIALGGLVAAWRWLPERLPPALSAAAVMRIVGVTVPASAPPPRPPAPPESQFDE